MSNLTTTKRILRYLIGTLDYEILFLEAGEGRECRLVEYNDSSWRGDVDDRESRSGYVFMLGGPSVT